MPFVWKCVWDAFAAVLEPLLRGSKRKHFSLTENGPPTCLYANQGFKHSKGEKKHLSPRVLRLKASEGFVCQAFPFWRDEISEDSVSMCLNAYFFYCFIWIPRELTFHPTFSVYLLDSFHVCLNISLYIKFGRVPACLQASVCACFPFFWLAHIRASCARRSVWQCRWSVCSPERWPSQSAMLNPFAQGLCQAGLNL